MTSGSLVAIVAMLFMEITAPRRKRLRVALETEALPQLTDFLRGFASSASWDEASQNRIVLVGEETLASLLRIRMMHLKVTIPGGWWWQLMRLDGRSS